MSQKESEWEESIKEHLRTVEEEYQIGGLSSGLYGDYAKEVARRAVSKREKEIAEEVEKKRLLENLPSEYEIQGFLRAHQKTAVVAFNKALDEVLSILNE